MTVHMELIVGNQLIERVIKCDYMQTSGDRFVFYNKGEKFECDCGSEHDTDQCIGSYPKSVVILKKYEV